MQVDMLVCLKSNMKVVQRNLIGDSYGFSKRTQDIDDFDYHI